ncbi:hypothetical protein P4679_24940 [Priestia megaterium]|uniref:hypothetical protein n=1 Tax=Priestia megaterium TaxID=1404 RepID=UPI002E250F3C|nr:hypothetical protein [Priestia megaterium]
MFSIIKVIDSPARDHKLFFEEALQKIEERLESFSGMDLHFTASSNRHKSWNFKLEAPVNAETPKGMGYAAQNMTICIDVDMSSKNDILLEREVTFKPTLQFYKASGELVTLDITDFGTTNIELVYDPNDGGFVFYSSNYKLFNYLKYIKEYAIDFMNNDVFYNQVNKVIKKCKVIRDFSKGEKFVIAEALKDIIETVESYHLSKRKPSNFKDMSMQEVIEQLKYIMEEMKR